MKKFVRVNRTFKGVSTNLSRSFKHIALALMLLTVGVGNAWGKDIFIDVSSAPSGYTNEMQVHYWGSGDDYVNASSLGFSNLWMAVIPDGATEWQVCRGSGGSHYDYQNNGSGTQNKYSVTGWGNSGSWTTIIGSVNGGYIYYDNSVQNWSGTIQFVIGHSSYSRTYSMTQLANTKIWYVNLSSATYHEWADATYYAVICSPSKVADGSWGSGSLSSKGTSGYTSAYTSTYSLNNGSTYMIKQTTYGNNKAMTITYYDGYANIPTNTMTISVRTKVSGGSYGNSYNSPTPVYMQARQLTNNGTVSAEASQKATVSTSAKSATKANVTTGKVDFSYDALAASADWQFDGWGTSTSTVSSTNSTYTISAGSAASKTATTIYAFFTRKPVLTVTKGANGAAASGSAANNPKTSWNLSATPNAGYKFNGWTTTSGTVTYGDASVASTTATISADATIQATFAAKTCTITFSQSGDGYVSGGQTANKTATYGLAMPTPISTPTAATGYKFMGYYSGTNGTGTKYYTETGASARTWNVNTESTTPLYAYFKKSEITLTVSPTTVAPEGTVSATAVVDPVPAGDKFICWTILHNNGTALDPQPSTTPIANGISFTAPADGGTYKVKAELKLGATSCDGGTLWDTKIENFIVATDRTINLLCKCGDYEIAAPSTLSGKPLEFTTVTAPTITGYTFSEWKLADGMTLKAGDAVTNTTIHYKATMDGNLTAKYTKKNMIFFYNTLGWNDVYVYFYNTDEYWSNSYGSGAQQNQAFNGDHKPYWEQEHGHMTQIGTTNIWYFDYTGEGWSTRANVVFTEGNQHNYQWFNGTNAVRRSDHDSRLPMYVPINAKTQTVNSTDYYNKGYWMNYPENTGYKLMLYDRTSVDGAVLINEVPFEFTPDKKMPMSITLNLSAETTYGYKILRADNKWFGNNSTMKNGTSGDEGQAVWEFTEGTNNCGLLTTAAGDYKFTLTYGQKGAEYYYLVGVHYPAQSGDFRIVYNDLAEWSQGSDHSENWTHPSRLIPHKANGVDTISFFVTKGKSPRIKIETITAINSTTGAVTWGTVGGWRTAETQSTSITESGVYNFRITQNDGGTAISSIELLGKYEGDYYIRCGALNSKWDYYRTDKDHLMTYSAFSESDENYGEKFSHYKAKWCPRCSNVKFCIANDYSPCISDTLIQDVGNPYDNIYLNDGWGRADGELKAETYDGSGNPTTSEVEDKYSANVRFMWNWKTNKISRAYVSSATNITKKFLVLQGDEKLSDHNGNPFTAANPGANATLLDDDQNWIYEVIVKAVPTARFKLYACYTTTVVANAQYFRGAAGAFNNANTVQLLGGSGSTPYTMRIIYDFKTNRLITAWMPDGTDVSGNPLNIQADVMIIRDHQEGADAITFTDNTKSLGQVKTVYGTMRFNRWTLNNRYRKSDTSNPSFVPSETETDFAKEHCNTTAAISQYHAPLPLAKQKSTYERNTYFISFPFDVNLEEVFGFGEYGTHWVISEYNGARRAQYGYFYDQCWDWDCTNWDYIWDRSGVTLHAYQGYLLSLDLDLMEYDDTTSFWMNQIHQVELYFPSSSTVTSISSTNKTIPGLSDEDYKCTKNYNIPEGSNPEGDRRVKDSYWRCIGVPSYAEYGAVLRTGETTITWQTDYTWKVNHKDFPFLYEWDVTDNSVTPQATSLYTFKPMHAYLVQNANSITWTAVNASPSPIVARRAKHQEEEENTEYMWDLTLTTVGDESHTFIRMTDDELVTDTFDFAQDLYKEFRDGFLQDENGNFIITGYKENSTTPIYAQGTLHSDIYTFIPRQDAVTLERAAANSMPIHDTKTTIPVGVRTKDAGEFTISVPNTHGVGIVLVDQVADTRTNLALGDYVVTLGQGQFDDRFLLEISPIKNTPTGVEETETGEQKAATRKMLIDGQLYIIRDEKVFDARGIRVQ